MPRPRSDVKTRKLSVVIRDDIATFIDELAARDFVTTATKAASLLSKAASQAMADKLNEDLWKEHDERTREQEAAG